VIAKAIVGLVVVIIMFFSFSPLNFGIFYLFVRPLLQPFADKGYTLMTGVPLTGGLALIFIFFSIIICMFRKGYSLILLNAIPLYLLMLFSITSLFNTTDYVMSISTILKIGTGVAMYCVLHNSIHSYDEANKVLYAIALTSIVPMLFGYYQFFTEGSGMRVNSIVGTANAYGEFLSISFCGCLMLLLQPNTRSHRIFLICVIASMVVSMIISRNRGQWIALFSSLGFAYFGYMGKIKARWLIISGILIAIFFSGMIIQRFEQLHEKHSWGGSKDTFEYRIEIWKRCIELIQEHPIIGHGIGTSQVALKNRFGDGTAPHNDYVRLLLETGVPVLFLYIMFLFVVLFNNVRLIFDKKNWFINYPMLVLIFYWIIHSSVQNMLYNVIVFPIFMALVAVSQKWNLYKTDETSS